MTGKSKKQRVINVHLSVIWREMMVCKNDVNHLKADPITGIFRISSCRIEVDVIGWQQPNLLKGIRNNFFD